MSAGTTTAKVDLRLSVLGEMQLHRALAGRIRDVSDFRPVFRRMVEDFYEMERDAFSAEGAYQGNPAWEKLNDRYAAWKQKHFPGANMLHRSGALLNALTGGDQSVEQIAPLRMEVGSQLRVGRWNLASLHQTGTKHMPKRKPVNLSAARKRKWVRLLAQHLRGEGRV